MKPNGEEVGRGPQAERQVILHPVLLAINSILFLYVEMFAFVDASAIARSMALALAAAALLWLGLQWWLRDIHKSALLTSLALALFFAYGAVTGELGEFGWFPSERWVPGAHLALLAVMIALWSGAVMLARKRRVHSGWTYFANVAGTAAVVIPFMIAAKHTYTAHVVEGAVEWKHESLPVAGEHATPRPPDIYWILPDTYGRADILSDVYGYDSEPFLQELRQRGFVVAPQAVSNYSTTALSVASVLNMDYVGNLMNGDIEDYFDWRLSRRLLHENRIGRFLKAHGYTTYSVATQFDNISWRSGHRVSPWWFLNYFESTLLGRTPIAAVSRMFGMPALHEHHRARTRFALDWVAQAAELPEPKFVFVQVVTPHPPFIVGPGGEAIDPPWPYSWAEGPAFYWMQPDATKEDYLAGYLNQVRYINRRLIETVDQIQAGSKRPPVIVVLSDHGPASGEWLSDLSRPEIIERFGVLSALSLPGVPPAAVPEDLSAVNTFRVILNQYFDTGLDLLPTKTYYTIEGHPYRYIPIELTARSPSPTLNNKPLSADSTSKATSALN